MIYDDFMDQDAQFSLERFFRSSINIQKASPEERACTSIQRYYDSGVMTIPPVLTGSDYTVSWDFSDPEVVSEMTAGKMAHLVFCSRIITDQEEIRTDNERNHYLRQVLEVIADESEKGIVLLRKEDSLLYENPMARKWRLSERFFNYCAESGDNNIETSESYTILLGGTSPLKIRLYNYYSGKTFIGRLILANPFSGETTVGIDTTIRKTSGFQKIIGDSPQLKHCINIARRAAVTDSSILIRGESGTGKEQFAKAIHNVSLRKEYPFIAINCAAIPEPLLESELFGYEKGAFTGADSGGRKGKLEMAHGGTVFLDEIGDMTPALQAKLLRVIQTREFEPLGGHRTIRADVRFISATHKNLEQYIENSLFRSDLYYRLNVIPLVLPALKDHKEEVEKLAHYFIRKYAISTGSFKYLSHQAMESLKNYNWPGNIRELENAIQYCMTITPGELIDNEDLPPTILFHPQIKMPHEHSKRKRRKNRISYEELVTLLQKYGNTTKGKKAMAEYLGISLATLYRKLAEEDL
ncbi:sigma-54-dependent Fis family transcriptional regulator [Oceanispirochaeta sp. M1]|uniref:sigma-54 interaction domain-containing protein n=2 Tax=Oceanispirochaeta TaxID=2035349 RepID=UPI0013148481|nr:sigma 54-interacting transcriptional regulator [Oceanispirochaeta sp. M1]